MKKLLAIAAVLILGIVVAIFISQKNVKNNPFGSTKGTATIKNHTFNLQIAQDPKEKEIGLSDRNDLSKDAGMLFVFERPDYYPFWMKNMKFPIDIIYINSDKIVTIHQKLPPASSQANIPIYRPTQPADKVLEIGSGMSEEYDFKVGDEVTFKDIE